MEKPGILFEWPLKTGFTVTGRVQVLLLDKINWDKLENIQSGKV